MSSLTYSIYRNLILGEKLGKLLSIFSIKNTLQYLLYLAENYHTIVSYSIVYENL